MNRYALLVLGLFAPLGIPGRAEGDVPWRRIRVPVECSQRGTTSTCLLRLSRSEIRDVIVEVPTGDQDVGFRLYTAYLGRWALAAEGVWQATPVSRHGIRAPDSWHGGPARLELTGEHRPPRLLGATMAVRDPVAVAAAGKSPRQIPAPARNVLPLEMEDWFPAAWPVWAEGARPGDTVRLDLPAEVLRQLGGRELGRLRLATPQGHLSPLELRLADSPRREAEVTGARLVPAERLGWLRLSIPARSGPAYSEIHLTVPPRPLLRRVSIAGALEEIWSCVPAPPLPCRLVLDLPGDSWSPARELPEIEVEGGEGRPLPPLEVSIWSTSETLIFTWPAQQPVRLLAGNDRVYVLGVNLEYSAYPGIPRRPSKRAVLGPEENAPLFRRWRLGGAVFAMLILAGLCLKEWRRRRLLAALLVSLCAAQARGEDASVGRSPDLEAGKPEGTLDGFEINAGWPVHAPGVAAGEVVRLELPVEVYLHGGSTDLLRLETAGRQVPYVLRALDEPAPVARGRLPPGQRSTLSLTGSPALTLTGCRLETRERVNAWFTSEFETLRLPTGSHQWSCVPDPASACVLEVEMPRLHSPGTLSLSAFGVFGEIDVTLLRQRHELVFVWPEGGVVRLLAGAQGPAAPTYDLHAVRDRLLARPWQPARLGRGQGYPASEPAQGLRQAFLSAAALALLFGVHWLMPRRSPPASV